jgi:hypothetical protein
MDPTLTVLCVRDGDGKAIATLCHVPCHAVCIYPFHKGISADWLGPVCERVARDLGGEAMVMQGCAGDIVPAKRGLEPRDRMSALIAERALAAAKLAVPVKLGALTARSEFVRAPLTAEAKKDLGEDTFTCEVQVVTSGSLALVTFPGEPLIGLAMAVQQRSPLPHTMVLGYSNGYGVRYVGLPGEKVRGGYEMGAPGAGADECGGLLVEAAVKLLETVSR